MVHEIWLFSLGIGAGLFLGALFDAGRALRKRIPHTNTAVALEDFVFWLVAAGVLFYLLEKFNKGVLRFYIFLGCGIGICFYAMVLTRLLFPVFLLIVKAAVKILGILFSFLGNCKKFVKKILILPLKKLWERIKIIRNNI